MAFMLKVHSIFAMLLGLQGSKLVDWPKWLEHLNIEMDKDWDIRTSDWEAHILTERQIDYAAMDVHVAIELFKKFKAHWWDKDIIKLDGIDNQFVLPIKFAVRFLEIADAFWTFSMFKWPWEDSVSGNQPSLSDQPALKLYFHDFKHYKFNSNRVLLIKNECAGLGG